MDGSRFDLWTRRRFGLVAGGAAAVLTGILELDGTTARKKRRRKKRKWRDGTNCRAVDEICAGLGGVLCGQLRQSALERRNSVPPEGVRCRERGMPDAWRLLLRRVH